MEPATQDRSRKTERALRTAAHRLLAERPFDKIRVSDLTERAGVSVGTFYRRFRDKRALLHLADEALLEDLLVEFDEEMSDERMSGKSLAEIVQTYVGLMVRKFRENRATILQVIRHADPEDASAFGERGEAFNRHVHGRLKELLRRFRPEITHPEPELALNLGIFFASAAARDAVWRGSLRAYPVTIDDGRLVEEISRACVAYLLAPATAK